MIKVKCYGGPAHGRTMGLNDATYRFEMFVKPSIDHRPAACRPFDIQMPPCPRNITNTYYLQTYSQTGHTLNGALVHRQIQVALLDGTDLLLREQHEVEDAMESIPWTWSQDPSILHQFEEWWEKALHDQGWEKVRVCY